MSAAPKFSAVNAIPTLDAIATDPTRAVKLTPEERAGLLMRAAAVIAALGAVALTAAPTVEGPQLLRIKEVALKLRVSRGHPVMSPTIYGIRMLRSCLVVAFRYSMCRNNWVTPRRPPR